MRLIAGVRTTFLESGGVIAQFGGGLPDERLPAVLASGACTGPYEAFESDLPAPDAAPPADAQRSRVDFRFGH